MGHPSKHKNLYNIYAGPTSKTVETQLQVGKKKT